MVNPAVFFRADISRTSSVCEHTQCGRTGLQPLREMAARVHPPAPFDYSPLFSHGFCL